MPGGDKTGPHGEGPMTGRRMGTCAGNDYYGRGGGPGFYGWGRGFGFRHGAGRGAGYGYGFGARYANIDPQVSSKTLIENEIRVLKDRLSSLEDEQSKLNED